MAVTSVKNTKKCSLTTNENGQPTYSISFQVITDSLNDGPLVAEGAIGVNLGDYFAFGGIQDTRAVCTGANTTTVDDYEEGSTRGFIYEVTLTYSQIENNQTPSSPLNSPAEFSYSFEKEEVVTDFDANGNLISNSAGDLYDPTITRPVPFLKLTITQNESSYDAGLALTYAEKVNSDPFQGAAAGTVLCESVTGSGPFFADDIEYWKVTYNFAFRADGWKLVLLDAGLREFDNSTPPKKQNIKLKGEEVTSAVPLDGSGRALAANATPVKNEHEIYASISFSSAFYFRT